jgi:hypothetical protein
VYKLNTRGRTMDHILLVKDMINQYNSCETIWGERRVIEDFLENIVPTIQQEPERDLKSLSVDDALAYLHQGRIIETGLGDEMYVTIKDLTTIHDNDLSEICGGRYEVTTNVPIVNRFNYWDFTEAFAQFNQIRKKVIDRVSEYQIL